MNRRNLLRATTAIGATGAVTGLTGTAAGAAAAAAPAGRPARTDGPLRVHVVMFDGVEELDFAAPYEVFSAARFFTGRPVEVRYVTASAPEPSRPRTAPGSASTTAGPRTRRTSSSYRAAATRAARTPASGPRSGGASSRARWRPRPAPDSRSAHCARA